MAITQPKPGKMAGVPWTDLTSQAESGLAALIG